MVVQLLKALVGNEAKLEQDEGGLGNSAAASAASTEQQRESVIEEFHEHSHAFLLKEYVTQFLV